MKIRLVIMYHDGSSTKADYEEGQSIDIDFHNVSFMYFTVPTSDN